MADVNGDLAPPSHHPADDEVAAAVAALLAGRGAAGESRYESWRRVRLATQRRTSEPISWRREPFPAKRTS